MNLYFRDSHGKKRLIASDLQSKKEIWEHVKKFLDDHSFKSYYTRIWYADGYTWYDVGSHTEFFCVDANLMEQYENEQEKGVLMYKNIFISQPMSGKSEEEILATRQKKWEIANL